MKRVDIKKILRNPLLRKELIRRGVKAMRELSNEPPHEVGSNIEKAIATLDEDGARRHAEGLKEGYKDAECPKCGTVSLAHQHFINCTHAHSGTCPMVPKGAKSLFQQARGEKAQDDPGFVGCPECGGPVVKGKQKHAVYCSKSKRSLAKAKAG